MGSFYFAVICLAVTVIKTEATCKKMKDNNEDAPSGVYSLTSCESGQLMEVYCEMGLNGGGYTFLKSRDLARLTDADIQSMFTDTSSFLVRLFKCGGDQPYIVLKQLSQYSEIPLKLGLNQNVNYADTQNADILDNPFLYFGFLPTLIANDDTTQGLQANDRDLTFANCDSNPNSYFALFSNFKETAPSNYSIEADYPAMNQMLDDALPNPSTRMMPSDYFYFMESHFGGCGWYTQTDSRLRSSERCILAAAIGFR